jgi:uncharacterized RDD family membrane protein YckC
MVYVPSTYRRVAAHFIDAIIANIFFAPMWVQFSLTYVREGFQFFPWKWVALCGFIYFLYRWLFYKYLGATIGKMIMGLKLVPVANPEGELGWLQSFIRVFADQLSIFFGNGLQALMFLRLDRTHVSDWVAETRVVQKMERQSPAIRRMILGICLCIYLSGSSFVRAYRFIKTAHFTSSGVIFERI